MIRLLLCLLLGVALSRPCRAAAAAESPYPAQSGPELALGDANFEPLFRQLADQGPVRSNFVESRWFPFRTDPIVLKGEMRFSSELGLSLHYLQPEERTVIADSRGLILKDSKGKAREIHPDERMPDLGGTLIPILRFDEKRLFEGFHVHGIRSGEAWRFDFVPKSPDTARLVGTVVVEGTGSAIRRIHFVRSAHQHIDIEIVSSDTHVTFGADERARYFR